MEYLKAILLAVVEGLTEFLPISSTGHLILVEEFLELGDDPEFARAFMIIIQLPAIFSVVLYFWRDLWPGGTPEERNAKLVLWRKIILAFVPAAVVGLLLAEIIEDHFMAPLPVAAALFVGGVVLIFIERRPRTARILSHGDLTVRTALFIGCFQCLALFPGVSRSAATIIGAMLLGCSRGVAAEFSFFLAIPTMCAATGYTLLKMLLRGDGGWTATQWGLLATGSAVSFLVAYASIAFLMGYIRKHSFQVFGYYRIVLAIAVAIVLVVLR